MRLISARDLPDLLPMADAIPLMREAFELISNGRVAVAERQALEVANGTGLLMGAALDSRGIAAKLVSIMPGNLQKGLAGSVGLVVLMDDQTGEALCLIDGSGLTALRTAALNACAIDLLARQNSETALLIGCGTQAAAQLKGLTAVREMKLIRVMGRDAERTAAFVDRHQSATNVELVVVSDPKKATDGVDIIIGATNSHYPVISGGLVPSGCHVSGIGSFKPEMCEFDSKLLLKSSIFVEKRSNALIEAGELIKANEACLSDQASWTELGEVISGKRPGRQSDNEITFFKSVGHAVFDLLAARAVFAMAMAKGVGQEWQQ
jgi:ornithine cyclodeaminase